jgi:hypothetical protein
MASEDLRAAVRRCYAAFAHEQRPRRLDASPLRDAEAIFRDLTSAPLNELSDEAIGPYSHWAITTVGTEADFRHFLPRILELAACSQSPAMADAEIIAGKVMRADRQEWTDDQKEAVRQLFLAAFQNALDHPVFPRPGDWLCGLAIIGEDPAARIADWRHASGRAAALDMAELITNSDALPDQVGAKEMSFWDNVDAGTRRAVARELMATPTRDYLSAAAAGADDYDRWTIEQALIKIERAN